MKKLNNSTSCKSNGNDSMNGCRIGGQEHAIFNDQEKQTIKLLIRVPVSIQDLHCPNCMQKQNEQCKQEVTLPRYKNENNMRRLSGFISASLSRCKYCGVTYASKREMELLIKHVYPYVILHGELAKLSQTFTWDEYTPKDVEFDGNADDKVRQLRKNTPIHVAKQGSSKCNLLHENDCVRTEDLRDIPDVTIHIYERQPSCILYKHPTEGVRAFVKTQRSEISVLSAVYCAQCCKYFAYTSQVDALQKKFGHLMCRLVVDQNVTFGHGGMSYSDLNAHSTLNLYRYKAGLNGLPTSDRQALLVSLIQNDLMKKHEIISWLSDLLAWKTSAKDHYAREDWKADIKFLNFYHDPNERTVTTELITNRK